MAFPLPSETLEEQKRLYSESTIRRHIEKWFDEVYVSRSKKPVEPTLGQKMIPGKCFGFLYDPKFHKQLDFYDNFPIIICLGHLENDNAFGINLSYIPPKVRAKVMDKITKIFRTRYISRNQQMIEKGMYSSQSIIPFTYDVAKKILAGSGFEFALRSYIYDRIHMRPLVISYEDWWKPLVFTSKFIKKLNKNAIYYRYKRQFSTEYKVGKKDPDIKVAKTKIKDINKYINKKKENKSS